MPAKPTNGAQIGGPLYSLSHFINRPTLTELPGGKFWQVADPLDYESDLLSHAYNQPRFVVFVPVGFVTDGASIPRIFWNIVPPFGPYGSAAIVHDYLYRCPWCSRRNADDTFLEAMKVLRCQRWQYTAIWLAVRLFGGLAWKKDQQNPVRA